MAQMATSYMSGETNAIEDEKQCFSSLMHSNVTQGCVSGGGGGVGEGR